jgi:L-lysine 6-transaminase
LVENARVVGEHLQKNLNALENEFPELVSNTRGLGLLCAMDLDTRQNRDLIKEKAMKKGLVLIGCSERTIRFRPPLNLSRSEADEGIDIIRRCLREMKAA